MNFWIEHKHTMVVYLQLCSKKLAHLFLQVLSYIHVLFGLFCIVVDSPRRVLSNSIIWYFLCSSLEEIESKDLFPLHIVKSTTTQISRFLTSSPWKMMKFTNLFWLYFLNIIVYNSPKVPMKWTSKISDKYWSIYDVLMLTNCLITWLIHFQSFFSLETALVMKLF